MATHSSVLAWRIPGTGEPGGLPSLESHSQTRLKQLSSSSILPPKESTPYYPNSRIPPQYQSQSKNQL